MPSTLTRAEASKHRRLRSRTSRDHQVYMVRTRPELYPPDIVELVHTARENAVNTIGTMWDWDCYRCERAVMTTHLSDPCPHCGSPDGVRPGPDPLCRTMARSWLSLGTAVTAMESAS